MNGVPISEAARRLGTSVPAIRMRIRRGTLYAYKRDGCWYVELDDQKATRAAEQDAGAQQPARPPAQNRSPFTARLSGDHQGHHRDELVDQLRSENEFLRGQLATREREASEQAAFLRGQLHEKDQQIAAWIDEAKRKDMLIAHLQERIVELPPGGIGGTATVSLESPETHESPRNEPQATMHMYRVSEPPKKPWWRFWQ